MDRNDYVHKRKGRYMAQTLEVFEEQIEPLIPADVAQAFKATVRRKMNALAVDCCELLDLDGKSTAINGHAQAIRDRINPDASRTTGRRQIT